MRKNILYIMLATTVLSFDLSWGMKNTGRRPTIRMDEQRACFNMRDMQDCLFNLGALDYNLQQKLLELVSDALNWSVEAIRKDDNLRPFYKKYISCNRQIKNKPTETYLRNIGKAIWNDYFEYISELNKYHYSPKISPKRDLIHGIAKHTGICLDKRNSIGSILDLDWYIKNNSDLCKFLDSLKENLKESFGTKAGDLFRQEGIFSVIKMYHCIYHMIKNSEYYVTGNYKHEIRSETFKNEYWDMKRSFWLLNNNKVQLEKNVHRYSENFDSYTIDRQINCTGIFFKLSGAKYHGCDDYAYWLFVPIHHPFVQLALDNDGKVVRLCSEARVATIYALGNESDIYFKLKVSDSSKKYAEPVNHKTILREKWGFEAKYPKRQEIDSKSENQEDILSDTLLQEEQDNNINNMVVDEKLADTELAENQSINFMLSEEMLKKIDVLKNIASPENNDSNIILTQETLDGIDLMSSLGSKKETEVEENIESDSNEKQNSALQSKKEKKQEEKERKRKEWEEKQKKEDKKQKTKKKNNQKSKKGNKQRNKETIFSEEDSEFLVPANLTQLQELGVFSKKNKRGEVVNFKINGELIFEKDFGLILNDPSKLESYKKAFCSWLKQDKDVDDIFNISLLSAGNIINYCHFTLTRFHRTSASLIAKSDKLENESDRGYEALKGTDFYKIFYTDFDKYPELIDLMYCHLYFITTKVVAVGYRNILQKYKKIGSKPYEDTSIHQYITGFIFSALIHDNCKLLNSLSEDQRILALELCRLFFMVEREDEKVMSIIDIYSNYAYAEALKSEKNTALYQKYMILYVKSFFGLYLEAKTNFKLSCKKNFERLEFLDEKDRGDFCRSMLSFAKYYLTIDDIEKFNPIVNKINSEMAPYRELIELVRRVEKTTPNWIRVFLSKNQFHILILNCIEYATFKPNDANKWFVDFANKVHILGANTSTVKKVIDKFKENYSYIQDEKKTINILSDYLKLISQSGIDYLQS